MSHVLAFNSFKCVYVWGKGCLTIITEIEMVWLVRTLHMDMNPYEYNKIGPARANLVSQKIASMIRPSKVRARARTHREVLDKQVGFDLGDIMLRFVA